MRDQPSNEKLAGVHPRLAAKVNAAAEKLAAKRLFFRVAQGLRDYAEQSLLYAKGRTIKTKPDGTVQGIVTNARPGYGNHNFGYAVDCYPFGADGKLNMTDTEKPEWAEMVTALKAEGLVWGGDWDSIKDFPHFQLAEVATTPTAKDRALFASGGIEAVWSGCPMS